MPAFLRHESIRAPVTALAFVHSILLAAEGPFLRCFDSATAELLSTIQVFHNQSIHGLAVREREANCVSGHGSDDDNPSDVLVWGGCFVRPLAVSLKRAGRPISRAHPQIDLGPKIFSAPDWILDLSVVNQLQPCRDAERAAAITAHNALILMEPDTSRMHTLNTVSAASRFYSLRLRQLTSGSRCILYAAHLLWLSHDRLLVAAGTAFGEILLWSARLSADVSAEASLHRIFTGHEGSIFGVRISPNLPCAVLGYRRILSSCSDDRTIRTWDITDAEESEVLGDPNSLVDALRDRETGFGGDFAVGNPAKPDSLALAWGHLSRIWGIRYVGFDGPGSRNAFIVKLISTGEDATAQLWHLEFVLPGEAGQAIHLQNRKVFAFHSGKNIWSFAMKQSHPGIQAVSGGADGAIATYAVPLDGPLRTNDGAVDEEWTMSAVLQTVSTSNGPPRTYSERAQPGIHSSAKDDYFRSYAFIDSEQFLVTTNGGKILRATIANQISDPDRSHTSWDLVGELAALRGYSVVASHLPSRTAFIAGSSGKIYAYTAGESEIVAVAAVESKVAMLFASSAQHIAHGADELLLLVGQVGSERLSLITLSRLASAAGFAIQQSRTLSIEPNFVVTSFTRIVTNNGERYIALGSRKGSIAFYEESPLESSDSQHEHGCQMSLVRRLENVHGSAETVTSLFWRNADEIDNTSAAGYLYSVGRDGSCIVHSYEPDNRAWSLVHKCSVPFGTNVEGIYNCLQTSELMVSGFRSKQFVLYSLTNEKEVMAVECGGAHRNWAFMPLQANQARGNSGGGTFVWTQASHLKICAKPEASHRLVQSGGHGREIKAVAASPVLITQGRKGIRFRLIATGAEDTDIRIFRYDTATEMLRAPKCMRILRKHMTGIQHLQWSEDGRYLFSSGGCEEFFVWKISSVPLLQVGAVCEAVCTPESEIPDLRITSFDARWNETQSNGEHCFLIVMAYSDSTIRVYRYSSQKGKGRFQLLHTDTYTSRCLTQCAYLSASLLLASSTDGHIAFWSLPSSAEASITKLANQVVHQSSIKALAHIRLLSGISLIITGGDDNALGITVVRHEALESSHAEQISTDPETLPSVSTLLIPRAHAAAITGCALVTLPVEQHASRNNSLAFLRAITTSNDQRVKVWDITVDSDKPGVQGIEVVRKANVPTAVADAGGMAVIEGPQQKGQRGVTIFVCGVGMESWTMMVGDENTINTASV